MKKRNTSSITWPTINKNGEFIITSNRGQSAEGFISKDNKGSLIFKVQNNTYNPDYLKSKMKAFVNEEIGKEDAVISFDTRSYSDDQLLTHAFGEKVLVANKPYTFDLNFGFELRNFLIDGLVSCNGQRLGLPIKMTYIKEVYETCDGVSAKWYSKFKKI